MNSGVQCPKCGVEMTEAAQSIRNEWKYPGLVCPNTKCEAKGSIFTDVVSRDGRSNLVEVIRKHNPKGAQ